MAAEALKKEGAKKNLGCCTHAILSGPAISESRNGRSKN